MQLCIFSNQTVNSNTTPLSYPGGKKHLWPYFQGHLPSGVKEIVSPFVGGGAIELKCSVNGIKVHASDKFEQLVNFWSVLLKDADSLVTKTVSIYPLTDEQRLFHHRSKLEKESKNEDGEPYTNLERAAIFWCLNKQTFSGYTLARGGRGSGLKSTKYFEQFRLWSNSNFTVACSDCFSIIERNNNTFMYLDPPYVEKEHFYGASGDDYSFDHERLASLLKEIKVPWILSYGDHELIHELYGNYEILKPQWQYTLKNKGDAPECKELLILNTR